MNDPWDVKSVRQSGQYISCMKLNGVPLLPPVVSVIIILLFHFVDCDSVQTFDVPDSNQVNIMCKALVQLQRLLGNLTFKIVSVARKIMLSLHIEVIFN